MHKVTELAISGIHPGWKVLLNTPCNETESLIDVLDRTITKIIELGGTLCPDKPDKILRCLRLNPDLIKVCVIGQDPYPQPGVATGLAFSISNEQTKVPASLNILQRELIKECEFDEDSLLDSTLESWEEQGVLLLNSSLSCEAWKAGSHAKLWEDFMVGLIKVLNDFKITRKEMTSLVFVFLGAQAQLYSNLVNDKLNYKILRYHPAAETHGGNKFVGFFKEVNTCLEESGQELINWI